MGTERDSSSFDFDGVIERRGTNSMKWDKTPPGTLAMGMADLDFAVPPPVARVVKARAADTIYGYTFPPEGLAAAIAKRFAADFRVEVDPKWLVYSPGIIPVLAVAATLRPGRIIANAPNYPMIFHAAHRVGKECVRLPLVNEAERYSIDFEALDRDVPPDADAYFLCNPHNPIGKVYTEGELRRLSELAADRNLLVVSDEAHCELLYEGRHRPFFGVDDYARENSVCFYTPGKTYNLPGLPFAFAVIPNPTLRERFIRAGYALGHISGFSFLAAQAAYAEGEPWRTALLAYLKANRDHLAAELRRRFPSAAFTHTEATYLQWIDFRPQGIEDAASFLRDRAGIIVTDGKHYGAEGYIRLNFGCPKQILSRALDLMQAAFREGPRRERGPRDDGKE
ncbi:MAG: aminotransferase class I/II-fold pyridoxal phosphate-dependent enzyme [Clostridiales Family XIII bacterium]|nr:aminotransferase class I/II-fold pyridoxal phosphate-dependent enzyme [Clostridiales Family XIII bacterium]